MLRFFEQRHLGDITSRFASLTAIRGTLTNGAVAAALDGAMSVATLALMTIYSARLTAVAVAALALYVAIRVVAFRPLRDETIVFSCSSNPPPVSAPPDVTLIVSAHNAAGLAALTIQLAWIGAARAGAIAG